MRLRPTLLGICLVAALAGPAPAQSGPATSPRAEAIELFKQSRAAYRQGKFREAAGLLRKAYVLDPAPTLLYNLARALESDGDFEGAVKAYRDYLAADPNAEDRAAIQQRIENLQTQLAERQELERRLAEERAKRAAPPPAPAAAARATPAPAEARGPVVVPWVVAGLGGAGIVAGAVLGGLAKGKHGEAEDAPVQADAVTLDDEARGLARGANIALVAGGAVAAGGLIWGLVRVLSADDPAEPPQVSLGLGPSGVLVHGRF